MELIINVSFCLPKVYRLSPRETEFGSSRESLHVYYTTCVTRTEYYLVGRPHQTLLGDKYMARHSISMGIVLGAALSTISCDSTVWLDDTLPSLTAVYASGACQISGNELDVSVVLVNQGDTSSSNILPTTRVAKEGATPVTELLDSGSFQFNTPPIMETKIQEGLLTEGVAYGEPEYGSMTGEPKTVQLDPRSIDFEWASPDPEAERIPLLILLMDQSASVLGLPSSRPGVRPSQMYGSDITHQRLTFFKSLVKGLDENYEVAMLTFSGFTTSFGADESRVNNPTLNRDLVVNEIERLNVATAYEPRTALNQALADAKEMIEGLEPDTYDPVVVVFTDGLESGDNSMNVPDINALAPFFVERHVPVHTLQLRSKVDPAGEEMDEIGRQAPLESMSRLACQTGGDFYYIRKAEDFTSNNDLGTMLRNRLVGRWSLKVQTPLFSEVMDPEAPAVMLTTELEATLAGEVERFTAAQSIQGTTNLVTTDNRIWILRQPQ